MIFHKEKNQRIDPKNPITPGKQNRSPLNQRRTFGKSKIPKADAYKGSSLMEKAKRDNTTWSEFGHGVLDAVGLVPGVGEIADGANALWYGAEGDKTNAALSAAAAVPFAGWAATAGKVVNKIAKSSKIATKSKKIVGKTFDRGYNIGDSSFITQSPKKFQHNTRATKLTKKEIQPTKAFANKGATGGKSRTLNNPLNKNTGYYNSEVNATTGKFIGEGRPMGTAGSMSGNNATFTMNKGAKVLDLSATGTTQMSVHNLNKYKKDGYDIIRGRDMTGATEWLPLKKKVMGNFKFNKGSSN